MKYEKHVLVWDSNNECHTGQIRYTPDGPVVDLESGRTLKSNGYDIFYEIKHEIIIADDGVSQVRTLPKSIRTYLKSEIVRKRPYAKGVRFDSEDIFPPSSGNGWYGRMIFGKVPAVYIIQKTLDKDLFWLSILDTQYTKVFESHSVQPYEEWILRLDSFEEVQKKWFESIGPEDPVGAKKRALKVLDEPSLSWIDLKGIISGVSCQVLRRGKTNRDILNQVVPEIYPESIREEIMAYLCWSVKKEIPKDDFLGFLDDLLPVFTLRQLIMKHLKYTLKDMQPSNIYKFILLAGRDALGKPIRPILESDERAVHRLLNTKLQEFVPDWRGLAFQYLKMMNKSSDVFVKLPDTREDASKDFEAWKRRFIFMTLGMTMRGYTRVKGVGLRKLLYIGAAHRWPHNHLSWSVRLGSVAERPSHMQVIIAPPNAVETIKRVIPKIIEIDWSARKLNLASYDIEKGLWKPISQKILRSVGKAVSKRKLLNNFGRLITNRVNHIGENEAKILDMIERGLYLTDFENPRGQQYWGVEVEEIRGVLKNLQDLGIVQLTYKIDDIGLVSLAIIIQGKSSNVYSLIHALLSYAPTSLVMVDRTGETSVVISRLSLKDRDELISLLPICAKNVGLGVRCIKPEGYRLYNRDLFQRLLTIDGGWNSDVSGLISQVRSVPKHIKDEIMREVS